MFGRSPLLLLYSEPDRNRLGPPVVLLGEKAPYGLSMGKECAGEGMLWL